MTFFNPGRESDFPAVGISLKLIKNREISWIFKIIRQNRSGQSNRSPLLGEDFSRTRNFMQTRTF